MLQGELVVKLVDEKHAPDCAIAPFSQRQQRKKSKG
jgi:hypothetical protein